MAGKRVVGMNLGGGAPVNRSCRVYGREVAAASVYPEMQRCQFCNALFTANPDKHIR